MEYWENCSLKIYGKMDLNSARVTWEGCGDHVAPRSALRKDLLSQLQLCCQLMALAVTSSRDGHSCRETAPLRPCPSWGIPCLMANPGRGMTIHRGATLMVHFGSEIPTRSSEAVVGPVWQLDFLLCTVLLLFSPSTGIDLPKGTI